MKKVISLSLALFVSLCIISCGGSDSDPVGDGISDPTEVANLMNSALQLPPGTFTVDPNQVEIDDSITITSNNNATIPIAGGQSMTNNISFNAPNGNVNAVGMRFGTSGPIYFVPINTQGSTSGTGSFDFAMLATICNDLSKICHDIKCYEFASTSGGQISRANIRDVAMMCGNCDEPSCQGLVDPSDCGLSGQDGSPRFNLTWNGNSDLDLYVTDPTGTTISFTNTTSSSGGSLDVDCTGNCSGGNSENITWPNGGPSGTYTVWVNNYSGGTTSFNIVVRDNGNNVTNFSGSVGSGQDSTKWTYNKN